MGYIKIYFLFKKRGSVKGLCPIYYRSQLDRIRKYFSLKRRINIRKRDTRKDFPMENKVY